MTKRIVFGFVAFLFAQQLMAQLPRQILRGQIVDAYSEMPIAGVSVSLLNTDPLIGTTTDDEGRFRFEELEIGRYQLQANHVAYEAQTFPEVLLESGKEGVLNIRLKSTAEELSVVDVTAQKPTATLSPLSTYQLTVEQTLRLPATFYDPARLAMTYPGVAATNDQANHLSIRGNSPNHMTWRLENVDIVNPNHLTNAGTFNDRATQNGGGVNILSAQMLGQSTFLTGALSSNYGNALSGVMDMRLRKGNDEHREYTAQIGLIGIDFAAEGPLSKKKGASYLVNYRYSTLGLLSALGVDLGDEEIAFQDLAFHLHFPTSKAGRFSVFGMGGLSENIFEGARDTAAWEVDKDRFDIRYDSKMGAVGITHLVTLGDRGVLRSAWVYSAQETQRVADELDQGLNLSRFASDQLQESRLSFTTTYTYQLMRSLRLELGGLLTRFSFDIDARTDQNRLPTGRQALADESAWLVEPFVGLEWLVSNSVRFNLGARYRDFQLYDEGSLEPRAMINWAISERHALKLAYGLHSQLQPALLFYELNETGERSNRLDDFTKAHHWGLGYTYEPDPVNSLTAEWYVQRLSGFPLSEQGISTFSGINLISGFPAFTNAGVLRAAGKGINYGFELAYQRYLADDYYLMLNGSLFDSQYTDADGVRRDTRFNSRYIINLTGGKEWIYNRKSRKRIFSVNARLNYHGGFRDTPIDAIRSAEEGQTVYDETAAFSIDAKDFFKIDLRIALKNNKRRFSSTVALDIQNVTNQQNIAYTYFDTQQNAVVTEYQLGIIPILSYRIAF